MTMPTPLREKPTLDEDYVAHQAYLHRHVQDALRRRDQIEALKSVGTVVAIVLLVVLILVIAFSGGRGASPLP